MNVYVMIVVIVAITTTSRLLNNLINAKGNKKLEMEMKDLKNRVTNLERRGALDQPDTNMEDRISNLETIMTSIPSLDEKFSEVESARSLDQDRNRNRVPE